MDAMVSDIIACERSKNIAFLLKLLFVTYIGLFVCLILLMCLCSEVLQKSETYKELNYLGLYLVCSVVQLMASKVPDVQSHHLIGLFDRRITWLPGGTKLND